MVRPPPADNVPCGLTSICLFRDALRSIVRYFSKPLGHGSLTFVAPGGFDLASPSRSVQASRAGIQQDITQLSSTFVAPGGLTPRHHSCSTVENRSTTPCMPRLRYIQPLQLIWLSLQLHPHFHPRRPILRCSSTLFCHGPTLPLSGLKRIRVKATSMPNYVGSIYHRYP